MGKGARREQQACNIYEDAGYETYRPATVQYGENDIFGLFDLLAVPYGDGPMDMVQVKSNRAVGIKEWSEEALFFAGNGRRVRFLVCHDREGWRLLQPTRAGYQTIYDGREHDGPMGEGLQDYLES